MSFFGEAAGMEAPPAYPQVEPWSRDELLAAEKEMLGFYVSAHPLDAFEADLRALNWPKGLHLGGLGGCREDTPVRVGGLVTQLRMVLTKKGASAGKRMAVFVLEDLASRCEAVMFAEDFERYGAAIAPDALVGVVGTVDRRRDRENLVVKEAWPLGNLYEKAAQCVHVRLAGERLGDEAFLHRLAGAMKAHPGDCPVRFLVSATDAACRSFVVEVGHRWRVRPTADCVGRMREVVGAEHVCFEPREARVRNGRRRFRGRDAR